jgi:hypothetical protein
MTQLFHNARVALERAYEFMGDEVETRSEEKERYELIMLCDAISEEYGVNRRTVHENKALIERFGEPIGKVHATVGIPDERGDVCSVCGGPAMPGGVCEICEGEDDMDEVAPPGWEGTVKAMKKHPTKIDNPWALSWSMRNKGYKSHKK